MGWGVKLGMNRLRTIQVAASHQHLRLSSRDGKGGGKRNMPNRSKYIPDTPSAVTACAATQKRTVIVVVA